MKFKALVATAGLGVMLAAGSASATLTSFQTYTGNIGYSADGWGSTSQKGTISASVPVGATVVAAYLYSSTFNFSAPLGSVGGTLDANPITYSALPTNPTACCNLRAFRADVTNIVKPTIDGGAGGVYNFAITEDNSGQDGEALVVVYSLPTLGISTFAILDGSASVTGDTTSINFGSPLDPTAAGFHAEMAIGDGFSCCSQQSTIKVNGITITTAAGNNDDSADGFVANGNLITVGGFDDPFSPLLPTYAADHERYNLIPQIGMGDTSIKVDTVNASQDDNIFLAMFYVTGEAKINTTPEPGSLALLGVALAGLAMSRRRRQS